MAIDKIQAESINLGDTFAFTGTVTGAGGLTLLSTTTLSSDSSVTLQSLMTGYNFYKVVYNIQRSAASIIRLTFMNGATELTSGYNMTAVSGSASSGPTKYTDNSQSFMNLNATWSSQLSATETPVNAFFYIINPNDSNDKTNIILQGTQTGSGSYGAITYTLTAHSTTAQAQDGLKFTPSTGNFANGFIKLYGIS